NMTFSSDGDLFVASYDNSQVWRFSFDSSGNAILDGSISVDYPVGLAMSPTGELLVTTHGNGIGKITRFLPDSSANYVFNWSIPSDANAASLLGIAIEPTDSAHLVVAAQPPASVTAGSTFSLTVTAKDRSGNLDSSFNGTVTVALATSTGGATLD